MKLSKKELKDFSQSYNYYKEVEDFNALSYLRQFLYSIDSLIDVENEAFLTQYTGVKDQYETMKCIVLRLFNKKKFSIKLALSGSYDDILDFDSDATEEDKRVYHACLSYIEEFQLRGAKF